MKAVPARLRKATKYNPNRITGRQALHRYMGSVVRRVQKDLALAQPVDQLVCIDNVVTPFIFLIYVFYRFSCHL